MAEPEPTPSPRPRHPVLTALYRVPMLALATIYFLIDDVVLASVRPVIAWAAEFRIFARLADALHRLPPYPTLAVFLVPYVVLEPFKLWALWLMASGRFTSGLTMLTISHLVSIVLIERLFHATRDKLLTIPWFARVHGWVMVLYDWSIGRLRETVAWHQIAAALARLRVVARAVAHRLAALGRATLSQLRAALGR